MLKDCLNYKRVGGSTQDKINYIHTYYERSDYKYEFKVPISELAKHLFHESLDILSFSETMSQVKINMNANPGFFFSEMGFESKLDSITFAMSLFDTVYKDWTCNPKSKLCPKEMWTIASRPKLMSIDKFLDKSSSFQPCARAISMPTVLEQLIGFPLYQKLFLLSNYKCILNCTPLTTGLQKYSDNWIMIGKILKSHEWIFTGDWSKFDQSIPENLMLRAIDVILYPYTMGKSYSKNYAINFRRYFTENIINKMYKVHDGYYIKVKNGVPSGSLWTNMLDSVINYIVISEYCNNYKIEHVVRVGGDDFVIGFNDSDVKFSHKFKNNFLKKINKWFGMKGGVDDCYLSPNHLFNVGYKRPVYKIGTDLSLGTSHLKPVYWERSETKFDSFDWNKGTSHRWNYDFSKRPCFLSFYWDENFRPIRPLRESMVRIVNPENNISNPNEYEAVLISHLIDNFNNLHCLNWIFHLYYDLFYIKMIFDEKTNTIPKKYDLFNHTNPYTINFFCFEAEPGERMWYRRTDKHIQFKDYPCTHMIRRSFIALVNKAIKVRSKLKASVTGVINREVLVQVMLSGQYGRNMQIHTAKKTKLYGTYDQWNKQLENKKSKEGNYARLCLINSQMSKNNKYKNNYGLLRRLTDAKNINDFECIFKDLTPDYNTLIETDSIILFNKKYINDAKPITNNLIKTFISAKNKFSSFLNNFNPFRKR